MSPTLSHIWRLQVEDNVTVILLSEIVWDKFRPNAGCFEPLLLHFPDYGKGRLGGGGGGGRVSCGPPDRLPARRVRVCATFSADAPRDVRSCTCDFPTPSGGREFHTLVATEVAPENLDQFR